MPVPVGLNVWSRLVEARFPDGTLLFAEKVLPEL
jgi:hypothetical protein